ncbi:MAG: Gfo/Idh/MocA family protein, partial [Chloroflexota bacterium]
MKKVRWGLVSTANINRKVIPAIRQSRDGVLAAVASREPQAAKAYAKEWEIGKSFGSYQAMLDSGAVDAVYISLPNHLHAEWTIKALQAGVHVLCEKPFALSLAEVDAMIAASRQTGKRLAEAFMYRHHPQTRLLGDWLTSGRLGEIRLVRGVFNFKLEQSDNVRLTPEFGGGSLWDVGVYPISLAQFVFGAPPLRVQGMQAIGASGVDEDFVGQMSYPGGGLAQIASSFRTPFHTQAEIVGSLGRLQLTRPFNYLHDPERRMTFFPAGGLAQEIETPTEELYLGEIEDMHRAILNGAPNLISLEQTRDHVRTALALYEAARTGGSVELAQARFA